MRTGQYGPVHLVMAWQAAHDEFCRRSIRHDALSAMQRILGEDFLSSLQHTSLLQPACVGDTNAEV